MSRSKDFILMDVLDLSGKKIGYIKDLLIDFDKATVKGFIVSSNKILQKNLTILKEDIISFSENMIVKKIEGDGILKLSEIKSLDVMNIKGDILGVFEDIIFDPYFFKIKGIVVSTGFVKDMFYGKKVILINKVILGEENLIYFYKDEKFVFKSMPHKLFMEVECYEKDI